MPASTDESRLLDALRARIDRIDDELLVLLKQRMDVVVEVAAYKKNSGKVIRDHSREAAILQARRKSAEAQGLSPEPVESIFRQIMMASRDYQASLGAAMKEPVEPRTITIVGGKGAMGQRMAGLMQDLGHQVLVADLDTKLRPVQAAAQADVVMIAVPIAETLKVIQEVGPHVRADALLMDITSLKSEFVRAMLDATKASVVGTHPMFGPGVHSLLGQRVVVCPGRGDAWQRWVIDTFEGRGLLVSVADADAHDRAMGLVQVLNHFQTQVFGAVLARSGVPLDESISFTSPAYLMELYSVARHFGQSPDLYGPIEMENPASAKWTGAFVAVAQELAEILAARDQVRFRALFAEVSAFFGDFTAEASERSQFLIDRLIERTLG